MIFILFESIVNDGFLLARMPNEIKAQQVRFDSLYYTFSNRNTDAPDISKQKITSPMLTHIKSAINNNEHLVEKNMYCVNKTSKGLLSIGLESHLIFVREGNKPPVAIDKSELFAKYRKLLINK